MVAFYFAVAASAEQIAKLVQQQPVLLRVDGGSGGVGAAAAETADWTDEGDGG